MKLKKDAKIYNRDGKEIGSLSRFVIDPRSKNVTNIVFKHGLLSQEEYIIPMRLVDHIEDTGIHLKELPAENLEDLPKFLKEEFIVADEESLLDESYNREDAVDSYFHYPSIGIGATGALYPREMFINNPSAPGPVGQQIGVPLTGVRDEPGIIRRTEENIPRGTVSMKEGSKVYSSDGKQIGSVERLFVDSTGQATHLVVSKGLLLKERKQIPVDWIDKIAGDEVYLAVSAPYTERLPDYQGK